LKSAASSKLRVSTLRDECKYLKTIRREPTSRLALNAGLHAIDKPYEAAKFIV
jgi:hypothetical protein